MDYYRRLVVRWARLAFAMGSKHLPGVLIGSVLLVFGALWVYRVDPAYASLAVAEIETFVRYYLPGWIFLGAVALVGLFVRAARELDVEREAHIVLLNSGLNSTKEQIKTLTESLQPELETTKADLAEKNNWLKSMRKHSFQENLWVAGHRCEEKHLDVVVRYADPRDRDIADAIKSAFRLDHRMGNPWSKVEIQNTPVGENPQDWTRILLRTDDEDRQSIAVSLGSLIGQRVKPWDAREGQSAAVEISIYDHLKKYD